MYRFLLLTVCSVAGAMLLTPTNTHALSCVDPASMINYYVTEPSYVVFTATAGETKEHVKQASVPDGLDPNFQFDEGYTAQHVSVNAVHKGMAESEMWVYHQKNSTWGYMCSSGPAETGVETVFVINRSGGMFSLPTVVNTYAADSSQAVEILTALEADGVSDEARLQEMTAGNWIERLKGELKEMVFLIRIKLAEWRWWREQ